MFLLLLLLQRLAVAQIPEYTRGKDYRWILNSTDARNGISYLGSHTRLRVAMDRLRRGEAFLVGGTVRGGTP